MLKKVALFCGRSELLRGDLGALCGIDVTESVATGVHLRNGGRYAGMAFLE